MTQSMSFTLVVGLLVGGDSWTTFESKEHGFKVLMPRKPATKEQNVGVKQTMYFVDKGESAFFVFHQENPPIPKGMERELLQKAADAMNITGKVQSTKFTRVDGFPAVDVYATVKMPAGAEVRNIIILADNKLYQVMVIGPATVVKSGDAEKFFKSFQLVK